MGSNIFLTAHLYFLHFPLFMSQLEIKINLRAIRDRRGYRKKEHVRGPGESAEQEHLRPFLARRKLRD